MVHGYYFLIITEPEIIFRGFIIYFIVALLVVSPNPIFIYQSMIEYVL